MWSLNNLANKAAGAINSAKKGLSEMAKEVPQEIGQEKKPEVTSAMLRKQCLRFKEEVEKQNEVILGYKKIIMEMTEDQKKSEKRLLSFKVVIGNLGDEEQCEVLQADGETQTLEDETQRLQEELDRLRAEMESVNKISQDNTENCKKELQYYQETHVEDIKKLKLLEEQSILHQEGLFKFKQRTQKNIIECYEMLKASYQAVGLTIPLLKPEQLGLEDLQEFIYTQSMFIEDTLKAFNEICIKFGGKAESLNSLKKIFADVINETTANLKQQQELAKLSEANSLKILKEKEDLHRLLAKKDEKLRNVSEDLKKAQEDCKNFDEVKENNAKLVIKIKSLVEVKETLERNAADIAESLKKAKEVAAGFTETNANLNKRLKHVNLTITDKENQVRSLQDQLSLLTAEFKDVESNFDLYKTTAEKNTKEVSDFYIKKIQEVTENFNSQITSLKSQLSKAQNEAKDANIAKIQSTKYQQAVEKLQDIVKNLETQSSGHISKIDKLTTQLEKTTLELKRKKDKLKHIKDSNSLLETELGSIRKDFEIEKQALISKANESELIKQEAERLLSRIEVQIQASDSMIDKRMITTFLLNYLNDKNSHKIKTQMLKALAEMLGLTTEERAKIGLSQEVGLFSHLASYISRS